ncbi:MAG: glycosyltransferase family 4 protein [Planctomycetota bacterium]
MKPLRFCFLTTFYPPFHFGGDAIGVRRLARALVRRGHEVTVVHDVDTWRALSGKPDPKPEPEPPGLEVVGLSSRLGVLSSLLTQQFGRPIVHGAAIERLLAQGRFDVIHYHNVSQIGGPRLLAMGGGPSVVKLYFAHEHWLVCPTHVLWRHQREPCVERQCLRCQFVYRRPPQIWRSTGMLERNLRHVDLFLAASEFSRRKHAEMGFPREMEVLPYFLPDEGPRAAAPPRPHERPYFLFVGRLERIKGLDDVIPAFTGLAGADLLVVGDGTHAHELKRIAAGAANVRFLGRVSDETLAACYAHALAVLVPSAGYETFGLTVIEAFREGLPVVARKIGPLPEMVESSGGGLVFSTPAELRSALDRLAADPALRARLGSAGREAWRKRWSEDVVVPRYLEIVERVAREKCAGMPARG